jgi:sec-independent protein translocase protein TatA/sec-independent protein translocase protein TatB
MFGLSFFELLAIFAVALLVFGPEKLPEIAKVLGKLSGELKRTSDSVRREFYNAVYPPAEELQATYRNLTTSSLAQLEGTCEEKTELTDMEQNAPVKQVIEAMDEHKDPPKTPSATYQTEDNSNVTEETSDSGQMKSEQPKGE